MIKKDVCKKILDICLSTGGDFAEIFAEDTTKGTYELTKSKVTKANTIKLHGVSIRILRGFEEVSGYTNDFSFESMKALAEKLCSAFPKDKNSKKIKFKLVEEKAPEITKAIKLPSRVKTKDKVGYLKRGYAALKNYSKEISQVICTLSDEEQNVLIVNSLGKYIKDLRTHTRLAITIVAGKGNNMQTSREDVGGNEGYEILDRTNIEKMATEAADAAIKMVHADEMVGGKMTVVVHNAFGGVLLHEACVHALEATSVAKGSSVFCNKLGKKIASDIVTAIDDGTRTNQWGSLNIDDEGNKTQRNVLIENGILKSYLVDYRNSRIMNHPITGSGRRQSYRYSPTSRMSNTFFAPGNSTFEEIIANTEYGLFAKKMGGGSVNPSTGEFNFAVNEGYMIENGKITKPVRGATLVGSGAEILMNIDMIGNNLDFGHGMCGSLSGSIPTDVGQPTIRVQNITVGGRGKK